MPEFTWVMTEEERKLAAEHYGLVGGYMSLHKIYDAEDYDACVMGLCRAAHYYDPSKGAFSTYAYRAMDLERRRAFRRAHATMRVPPEICVSLFDQVPSIEGDERQVIDVVTGSESDESDIIFRDRVERFLKKLPAREQLVIKMLYDGMTQREISEKIGVSHQRVNEIRKHLRERYVTLYGNK